MRIRFFVPILALSIAGCGSSYTSTDGLLAGVHNHLEKDDTALAGQWLASAAPEVKTESERKEYQLLQVELDIRSGRTDRAVLIVDRLLSEYPRDPRVNEVAGKTRLMQGNYVEAAGLFELAVHAYGGDADAARATDLLALARGFEAYARGRVGDSEERWTGIADDRLRAGVLAATTRDGDDVLARNH